MCSWHIIVFNDKDSKALVGFYRCLETEEGCIDALIGRNCAFLFGCSDGHGLVDCL
jgi:hypothetical protein